MLSYGSIAYGAALSVVAAVVLVRLLLHERRLSVLASSSLSAGMGALLWNLILRHTGGAFFVDAPGYVFPISFQDTGSGVFATALAALVLGFGPMRASNSRRVATVTAASGLAALLVDVYLY